MATLPTRTLPQRIDAVNIESYPRPHLGASVIGEPCRRKNAYAFHWAHKNKVDGRLERIFRLGDACEELIINALATIDIKVTDGQLRITDETGHFGGSIDGIAHNVPGFDDPLLFEAKSMNHSNFLEIARKGVQAAKITHYVQMQMYMGYLKMPFALYVVINKNDSKLYTEILPFDEDCYKEHDDIADQIIRMNHINEFPRISTNPSWFSCKFCHAKDLCHHGMKPERNCRTCQHSRKADEGQWACVVEGEPKALSLEAQEAGCVAFELGRAWI